MKTLLRSAAPFGLGLALLAPVAGCSPGSAHSLTASVAPASPAQRLIHVMPRGGSSTASVHTLPNSVCRLQVTGNEDAGSLRLLADDQGVARLHLDHLDPTNNGGELAMTCTDESGAVLQHTIEVQIDDNAIGQEPEKYNTAGKPTLPLLAAGTDPTTLSDDEIMARHYPPRPDAATHPTEYDTWLQLVKSAPAVLDGKLMNDTTRTHGSYTGGSNNWSGYVLTNPAKSPYVWVYGEWNVPRSYAESGFYSSDYSSFWVGLDGWGSPDVVQDGTDSDTLTVFWIQSSWYSAWVEWFPINSQTVWNFPVSPGDDIHAWSWVRDSAGNWDANATVGWFYMWNATQGYYVYTSINVPKGTKFQGNTAEWVMERPTESGSLSHLANYSWAEMRGASAYDLAGAGHLYGGDSSNNSWNLTMTGSNNASLSTVAPLDSQSMAFTYHGHQ